MALKLKKKLVIFDCDGVLVDSEIIANRIIAESLTTHGYTISAEESVKKFAGLHTKQVQEIIHQESGINIPQETFNSIKLKILEMFSTGLSPLMQSCLNILEAEQIDRCVASSSPRERVLYSLQLSQQLNFFKQEHIFTSQQVLRGKPAPDLFLLAAEQLGYAPEDCLVIEDSIAGIQAAQAAGMNVLAFVGATHARFDWYQERLCAYNIPLVHHPTEIIAFIEK